MKVSKVEEKLDKLFDNYLDIYTTMVDQGKQLEIQNEHLKEHMRRTALLEEKVGLKHITKTRDIYRRKFGGCCWFSY